MIANHQTSECSLPDCFCHRVQEQLTEIATESDFDSEWNSAPNTYRRVTEREIAEYFYLRGRRLEREAILAIQNDDLREMCRILKERKI